MPAKPRAYDWIMNRLNELTEDADAIHTTFDYRMTGAELKAFFGEIAMLKYAVTTNSVRMVDGWMPEQEK